MGALVAGIITLLIGIVGIVRWSGLVIDFLKGSVPLMLLFGGLLAIIAGITSIKDSIEAKKLEEEAKEESKTDSTSSLEEKK
jgi:F0F1-type ATP synthase assembly protein I